MEPRQVFNKFVENVKLDAIKTASLRGEPTVQLKESILLKAFLDIDSILNFTSMAENDLAVLLNYMRGIPNRIHKYPTRKSRIQFFGTINQITKLLVKLKSLESKRWGLDPSLTKSIDDMLIRLKDISESEKEWKSGRNPERNRPQVIAIKKIYELLKKSQSEQVSSKRWKNLKIEKIGTFENRKSFANQKNFEATPARLISNFAKGLGLDLSELAVEDIARSSKVTLKTTS
ncbi:MAG: hypothetical protein AB7F59_11325 [Bdellovibrionales bacterium]